MLHAYSATFFSVFVIELTDRTRIPALLCEHRLPVALGAHYKRFIPRNSKLLGTPVPFYCQSDNRSQNRPNGPYQDHHAPEDRLIFSRSRVSETDGAGQPK